MLSGLCLWYPRTNTKRILWQKCNAWWSLVCHNHYTYLLHIAITPWKHYISFLFWIAMFFFNTLQKYSLRLKKLHFYFSKKKNNTKDDYFFYAFLGKAKLLLLICAIWRWLRTLLVFPHSSVVFQTSSKRHLNINVFMRI